MKNVFLDWKIRHDFWTEIILFFHVSGHSASDQEMGSNNKPDLLQQQYSNLAPISTRLKSLSKEDSDLQPHRDSDDISRGTTSSTAYSISTSAASNSMV